MIDFTNCRELPNKFKGSEKKKTIEYDGKIYMLKFPDPVREKRHEISYINNVVSEYIGCKVYESVGIEVQKVLLGKYRNERGNEKVVCACEDFEVDGNILYAYKNFLLSDVDTNTPNDTELDDLLESIKKNQLVPDKKALSDRFWDMFVVDAFIGNQDRHPGNWGLLGTKKGITALAPVYDCGSSLFPTMGIHAMQSMPKSEYKNKAYNVYSCYRRDSKRIHANNFIMQGIYEECNEAVKRIVPSIDMNCIKDIINGIEGLSDVEKVFYSDILDIRYKDVLKPALNRIYRMEKEDLYKMNNKKSRQEIRELSPRL